MPVPRSTATRAGTHPEDTLFRDYRIDADREALRKLVDAHAVGVYNTVRAFLPDPIEAGTACVETFLRVLRARQTYRPDRPFRPWLYRSAIRIANGIAEKPPAGRARRRLPRKPATGADPAERLREAVYALPTEHRLPLVLYHFRELSLAETASALDLPEEMIQDRIARARETLRERLLHDRGMGRLLAGLDESLRHVPEEEIPEEVDRDLEDLVGRPGLLERIVERPGLYAGIGSVLVGLLAGALMIPRLRTPVETGLSGTGTTMQETGEEGGGGTEADPLPAIEGSARGSAEPPDVETLQIRFAAAAGRLLARIPGEIEVDLPPGTEPLLERAARFVAESEPVPWFWKVLGTNPELAVDLLVPPDRSSPLDALPPERLLPAALLAAETEREGVAGLLLAAARNDPVTTNLLGEILHDWCLAFTRARRAPPNGTLSDEEAERLLAEAIGLVPPLSSERFQEGGLRLLEYLDARESGRLEPSLREQIRSGAVTPESDPERFADPLPRILYVSMLAERVETGDVPPSMLDRRLDRTDPDAHERLLHITRLIDERGTDEAFRAILDLQAWIESDRSDMVRLDFHAPEILATVAEPFPIERPIDLPHGALLDRIERTVETLRLELPQADSGDDLRRRVLGLDAMLYLLLNEAATFEEGSRWLELRERLAETSATLFDRRADEDPLVGTGERIALLGRLTPRLRRRSWEWTDRLLLSQLLLASEETIPAGEGFPGTDRHLDRFLREIEEEPREHPWAGDPNDADYVRAGEFRGRGMFDEALGGIDACLARNPDHIRARILRLRILERE